MWHSLELSDLKRFSLNVLMWNIRLLHLLYSGEAGAGLEPRSHFQQQRFLASCGDFHAAIR